MDDRRCAWVAGAGEGDAMSAYENSILHVLKETSHAMEILHMTSAVWFIGSISAVTPDGRSGIVKLGQSIAGNTYAVISPKTIGRIGLMNDTGSLQVGEKVAGQATIWPDALMAISVYKVDLAQPF